MALPLPIALFLLLSGCLPPRPVAPTNPAASSLQGALIGELEKQHAANQADKPVQASTAAELVAHGAPLEAAGASGWTPLICASAAGDTDTATLLLARGASPHAADRRGWTPLRFAVFGSNVDLVRLLLVQKASPNAKDATGETPLMAAVWFPDPDDPTVTMSPAIRADSAEEVKRRSRIVDLLLAQGAEVNAKDQAGDTALKYALSMGNLAFTKKLIQAGAEVNVVNGRGNTPLGFASARGRPGLVDLLKKSGAKGSREDALGEAMRRNDARQVARLLREGAKVTTRDLNSGETILGWASRRGDVQLARKLLDQGAGVNERGELDWTPLMGAVAENRSEVVRLLLSKGANPNLREVGGKTALSLARAQTNTSIIRLLTQAGAKN